MLLTEEQAKEKWCPNTRVSSPHGTWNVSIRRESVPHTRCIASQCMAWRFYVEPIYGDAGGYMGQRQTDKGYCGAFGVPKP